MKTSSDPREWYRQEEMARDRAGRQMSRRRSRKPNLAPMYILAALIAVGALYLLAIALGFRATH